MFFVLTRANILPTKDTKKRIHIMIIISEYPLSFQIKVEYMIIKYGKLFYIRY